MQKANIKKIRLSPDSLLDWLSIDTTYNSLRGLYRSAKIAEQKKTHLSIFFLPQLKWVGTIIFIQFEYTLNCNECAYKIPTVCSIH